MHGISGGINEKENDNFLEKLSPIYLSHNKRRHIGGSFFMKLRRIISAMFIGTMAVSPAVATITISVVPILLVFAFFSNYIISSVSAGAVKE